jgi:hypothetical protein
VVAQACAKERGGAWLSLGLKEGGQVLLQMTEGPGHGAHSGGAGKGALVGEREEGACGPWWVVMGRTGKKGDGPGPRRIGIFSIYSTIFKGHELIQSKEGVPEFNFFK